MLIYSAVVYQPKDFSKHKPSLPVALVLDGIEDEGHVGTLIRSAAATGVEKVFVTKSNAFSQSDEIYVLIYMYLPIERLVLLDELNQFCNCLLNCLIWCQQ